MLLGHNAGFEISSWMHLSVGQVDCKNHFSECTIHLSEIYKANATYVKIRNTQSSLGQVLRVFHLSDCHFYLSQRSHEWNFEPCNALLSWVNNWVITWKMMNNALLCTSHYQHMILSKKISTVGRQRGSSPSKHPAPGDPRSRQH